MVLPGKALPVGAARYIAFVFFLMLLHVCPIQISRLQMKGLKGGGLLFKEGTNLNAEFLSNTIISPPGPTPPFEQLVPLGHTW